MQAIILLIFIGSIIYSRFAGKNWKYCAIGVSLPLLATFYLILTSSSTPSVCYDLSFCSPGVSERDLFIFFLFLPAAGVSLVGIILVYFLSRKSVLKEKFYVSVSKNNPGATSFVIDNIVNQKMQEYKNATKLGRQVILNGLDTAG